MNYGEIKKIDIANGEGVRVSLFVSGCRIHCPGCFNTCTWNFDYGKPFTQETEKEIMDALSRDFISGLTILGGEPFEEDCSDAIADAETVFASLSSLTENAAKKRSKG